MRTFKFVDDDAYKFWKIELSGTSYTVTYGRIGTKGQTSTKSFASEPKAKAAYDKIIAEKLEKGYVETTPVQASPKVENALEQAILDQPDDIANHAAFADLLNQQGDPRGEFIQVQLHLENENLPAQDRKKLQKREKELLEAHGQTWLGGLAEFLIDQKGVPDYSKQHGNVNQFQFARGWLDAIQTSSLTVNFSRALVKSPEIRLLRRLQIDGIAYEEAGEYEPGDDTGEDDYSPAGTILQRLPQLPNMRVLYFGEPSEGEYAQTHVNGEPAVEIVEKMPNLEELYLNAHRVDMKRLFNMTTLSHLRILQVHSSNRCPLELLAKNNAFENLTHILIFPHAMEYDDEEQGEYIGLKGVRALLRSPHIKKLTHLQLRLSDMGNDGIKEIVDSGILKQLKMLDLYGGVVTDEGAALLAKSPDIKNLDLLEISSNRLTKQGINALEKTGIKLNAKSQYDPNADDNNEYLYMGDME